MSRVFKYNDANFEVDFNDADFFERYWDCCEKLGKQEEELKKGKNDRGFMRKYCEMFYTFFDGLFGDGSGQIIYRGKYNASECEKVYMQFIRFCGKEVEQFNQDRIAFAHKNNGPAMNRQQRRNGKKHKGNRNVYPV